MKKNPSIFTKPDDWRLGASSDTIRIVTDLLPRFYRSVAGSLPRDGEPTVIPERILFRLLGLLSGQPATSLTELAARLGISKTNASPLVEKLVQDGLLIRTPHSNDRRIQLLSLTEKGQQTVEKGYSRLAEGLIDRFASLDEKKGQAFCDALKVLVNTLPLLL